MLSYFEMKQCGCDNSLRIMKFTQPINNLFPNAVLFVRSHTQPGVTHLTMKPHHCCLYQILYYVQKAMLYEVQHVLESI